MGNIRRAFFRVLQTVWDESSHWEALAAIVWWIVLYLGTGLPGLVYRESLVSLWGDHFGLWFTIFAVLPVLIISIWNLGKATISLENRLIPKVRLFFNRDDPTCVYKDIHNWLMSANVEENAIKYRIGLQNTGEEITRNVSVFIESFSFPGSTATTQRFRLPYYSGRYQQSGEKVYEMDIRGGDRAYVEVLLLRKVARELQFFFPDPLDDTGAILSSFSVSSNGVLFVGCYAGNSSPAFVKISISENKDGAPEIVLESLGRGDFFVQAGLPELSS